VERARERGGRVLVRERDAGGARDLDERRRAHRACDAEVALAEQRVPAIEGDRLEAAGRRHDDACWYRIRDCSTTRSMAIAAPRECVRTLRPAMLQASAIAAALEGRVPNVPKPDEHTAVKAALTIADTAAQEALLVPLVKRFREAQLEAEEDTRSVGLFGGGG